MGTHRLSFPGCSHDCVCGRCPEPAAAESCDNDEEFARQLAQQLANEAAGGGSSAPSAVDDEWVTVSGGKKTVASSDSDAVASGSSVASASGGGGSGSGSEALPAAVVADAPGSRDANAALAQQWGHWFTFNDSNVTAMGVTSLQKAFKGPCALSLPCETHGTLSLC